MIVLAIAVFCFCLWAVFSKHFCDGIVAKHLLTFAAITAALVVCDSGNLVAMLWSLVFLVAGVLYWAYKHWSHIREHFHMHMQ